MLFVIVILYLPLSLGAGPVFLLSMNTSDRGWPTCLYCWHYLNLGLTRPWGFSTGVWR